MSSLSSLKSTLRWAVPRQDSRHWTAGVSLIDQVNLASVLSSV